MYKDQTSSYDAILFFKAYYKESKRKWMASQNTVYVSILTPFCRRNLGEVPLSTCQSWVGEGVRRWIDLMAAGVQGWGRCRSSPRWRRWTSATMHRRGSTRTIWVLTWTSPQIPGFKWVDSWCDSIRYIWEELIEKYILVLVYFTSLYLILVLAN